MAKKKNKETLPITNTVQQKPWIKFFNTKLTERQVEFMNKIINNEITFAFGPAGTSKTFTACYTALKLLEKKDFKRIIIVKPTLDAGDSIGWIPGTVENKVDVYLDSFYDNMSKIIDKKDLGTLINNGQIVFKPVCFMRGVSFDSSIIVADEMQNLDFRQIHLLISRIGHSSKIVVAGDVSQYDIDKNKIALPKYIEMVNGIKGITTHEFNSSDIVRNKILIEITNRYDKWVSEGKVTPSKYQK